MSSSNPPSHNNAAANSSQPPNVAPRKPSSRKSAGRHSNAAGAVGAKKSSSSGGERTVRRLRLSKALTIPESTTVADACRRMASRRVDSCLLTDSHALLCGIVTDKDLALKCVGAGLPVETTKVSSIMTKNPVFVTIDSSAVDALQKMVKGRFRHLPVVENGEVVALLDITKCLYDAIARMERAAEKGHAIASAIEGVEKQWGEEGGGASGIVDTFREKLFRPSISAILGDEAKLAVVQKTDAVLLAAQRMRELKVSSVIVTGGANGSKKPIGIFTSKDVLLRVLALGLRPEETIVEKVMTPNPECISTDTSVVDALHTMHDGRFLHLPVVDKEGNCVACLDVLQLTHGAVMTATNALASKGGASGGDESSSVLMQRFWDSALSLDQMGGDHNDNDSASVYSGHEGLDGHVPPNYSVPQQHHHHPPQQHAGGGFTFQNTQGTPAYYYSQSSTNTHGVPLSPLGGGSVSLAPPLPSQHQHPQQALSPTFSSPPPPSAQLASSSALSARAKAATSADSAAQEGTVGPPLSFKMEDRKGRKHRFSMAVGSESMSELICAVASRLSSDFNPDNSPEILFEDEEGDRVVLSSDEDLKSAMDFARAIKAKSLRLHFDFHESEPSRNSPAKTENLGHSKNRNNRAGGNISANREREEASMNGYESDEELTSNGYSKNEPNDHKRRARKNVSEHHHRPHSQNTSGTYLYVIAGSLLAVTAIAAVTVAVVVTTKGVQNSEYSDSSVNKTGGGGGGGRSVPFERHDSGAKNSSAFSNVGYFKKW